MCWHVSSQVVQVPNGALMQCPGSGSGSTVPTPIQPWALWTVLLAQVADSWASEVIELRIRRGGALREKVWHDQPPQQLLKPVPQRGEAYLWWAAVHVSL